MHIFGDADVAPDFRYQCDHLATPIDPATCHHGFFLNYPTRVDRWWPGAFNFLTRHGVR
jgi:hypothetical protein